MTARGTRTSRNPVTSSAPGCLRLRNRSSAMTTPTKNNRYPKDIRGVSWNASNSIADTTRTPQDKAQIPAFHSPVPRERISMMNQPAAAAITTRQNPMMNRDTTMTPSSKDGRIIRGSPYRSVESNTTLLITAPYPLRTQNKSSDTTNAVRMRKSRLAGYPGTRRR